MRNKKIIVVLSGEIASGKSTLAKYLHEKHGFEILKTSKAIREKAQKKYGAKKNLDERGFLQKFGESLDKETNGRWILNHFQEKINENYRVIVDSVRIKEQIDALRVAYGPCVVHIHLQASPAVLSKRFKKREEYESTGISSAKIKEKYGTYKSDITESNVMIYQFLNNFETACQNRELL